MENSKNQDTNKDIKDDSLENNSDVNATNVDLPQQIKQDTSETANNLAQEDLQHDNLETNKAQRVVPSVDKLLDKVGSRYKLVMDVAKRAREINSYYSGLADGLLENEGPKVKTYKNESSINIALDEINQDKL
jgi:DNA-directed RNA polymerase omega subunit